MAHMMAVVAISAVASVMFLAVITSTVVGMAVPIRAVVALIIAAFVEPAIVTSSISGAAVEACCRPCKGQSNHRGGEA
jgi:hypothetical protein